jgi:lipoprotein-anchoring transpeptidase ErfK/SrfK
MRRWFVGAAVLMAVLSGGTASAVAGPAGSGERNSWATPEIAPLVPPPGTVGPLAGAAASPSTSAPATAPTSPPSTAPVAAAPACPVGDKQREAETSLAAIGSYGPVVVDGVQTPGDCATIIKFQKRFGISPANGKAGPTTADVARRIAASLKAGERAKCTPGASALTACVDLALQTMWVIRADGSVAFGPTVVRTGFRGYATPAGSYKVNRRAMREWSIKYKVWLPYWQHFTSGMGFHETTTYLHNMGNGSHGCVNLLRADARELWNLIGNNTAVKTFGRRPGT